MHYWLCLAGAIVLEVAGTTAMKLSEGFTKPLPSILIFIFYAVAFTLLTLALKRIDISVAYARWSGVGIALIVTIGCIYFKEPLSLSKLISLGLFVMGVVGLNLSDIAH
jgi:small multidrug resistance pump